MPNRIIKDSLLSSDKIAALSDFEFRLWVGLILSVDDKGRGDARAAIIKGRVFPLRERVSLRDIEDALHGLAAKGCISLYTVGGKSYFWFPTWGKHQRIRNVRSIYPGPEGEKPPCGNSPHIAADCGSSRPEDEDEYEDESESESEDEDEPHTSAQVVAVVLGRLGSLSARSRAELEGFVREMGAECVQRAMDAAQDAGKLNWDYIRGILRKKREQGVKSPEDWDRVERQRKAKQQTIAGTPKDVQPSPEHVRKNSAWLEEFLEKQEQALGRPGPAPALSPPQAGPRGGA